MKELKRVEIKKNPDIEQIISNTSLLCDLLFQNKIPEINSFESVKLINQKESNNINYCDFSLKVGNHKYFAQYAKKSTENDWYNKLALKSSMSAVILDDYISQSKFLPNPQKLIDGYPISEISNKNFLCLIYPFIDGTSFDELSWNTITYEQLNYIASQAWHKRRGLLELGIGMMDMGIFLHNTIIGSNFKLKIIDAFELGFDLYESNGLLFELDEYEDSVRFQLFYELEDIFWTTIWTIQDSFIETITNRTRIDLFTFHKHKMLYYIGCYLSKVLKDKISIELLSEKLNQELICKISQKDPEKVSKLFNILKQIDEIPNPKDSKSIISWAQNLLYKTVEADYPGQLTNKKSILEYLAS